MEQEGKKTSEEWSRTYPMIIKDPDGWDRSNFGYSWHQELITEGEFAIRAAMSTCVPRGISFGVLYKKISEWAAGVFGADRPVGDIVKKLHLEAHELHRAIFFLERNWDDKEAVYSELADCVILLMNLGGRLGLDYVAFTKVVEAKYHILLARDWDKLPDGTYQHRGKLENEDMIFRGDLKLRPLHWDSEVMKLSHSISGSILEPEITYYCPFCGKIVVDAESGFDTCQECLSKI